MPSISEAWCMRSISGGIMGFSCFGLSVITVVLVTRESYIAKFLVFCVLAIVPESLPSQPTKHDPNLQQPHPIWRSRPATATTNQLEFPMGQRRRLVGPLLGPVVVLVLLVLGQFGAAEGGHESSA